MASDEAVPHKKRVLRVKRLPHSAPQPDAAAIAPRPANSPPAPQAEPKPAQKVEPKPAPKAEPTAATAPEPIASQAEPPAPAALASLGTPSPASIEPALLDHAKERAETQPETSVPTPQVATPAGTAASKTPRRRGFMARMGHAVGAVVTFLLIVAGITFGAVAWQLSRGPIALDIITELVSTALETQFGEGYDVEVQHTDLRNTSEGLVLGIEGVTVRDPAGRLVVSSPEASVSIDPMSLLRGRFRPREIEFIGLAVAVTISPTGQLSVSADTPDQAAMHRRQRHLLHRSLSHRAK